MAQFHFSPVNAPVQSEVSALPKPSVAGEEAAESARRLTCLENRPQADDEQQPDVSAWYVRHGVSPRASRSNTKQ
jgi:hypothetical protein